MKVFKFYYWCNTATDKIKYRPDRNAVNEELFEHMQERYESFRAQGLSEDDAVDKTIEAMGSAKELAKELEKIHNPFWLYMLRASRVALILLILIALPVAKKYLPAKNTEQPTEPSAAYNHPFLPFDPYLDETYNSGSFSCNQITCFEPEATGSIFPFPTKVLNAALWHTKYYNLYSAIKKDEYDSLYIQLEISQPENAVSFSGVNDVHAVDSLGNYYYSSLEAAHDYGFTALAQWHLPFVRVCCSDDREVISTIVPHGDTYEILLANFVSGDAEWVELRYERDGRNYALRINLPGGDSYE